MHYFKWNPINQTSWVGSPRMNKSVSRVLCNVSFCPVYALVSISLSIKWQNIQPALVYCSLRFSIWCLVADGTDWFHECVFLCVSLLRVMWLRVPQLCVSVEFKHFSATISSRSVWTVMVFVCICVCATGSGGEHHQHAVAANGEWFGGAETFTDRPGTADY